MSDGIYVALSGAVAQSSALDIVANNVANAGTDGFRPTRASFGEVLATADGASYVGLDKTEVDATGGSVRATGNPLDVAIDGEGFFVVQGPNGPRYTRTGAFHTDPSGALVTSSGEAVLGRGGAPIVVPPDAAGIQIDTDGTIRDGETELGRLDVVHIPSDQLVPEEAGLFRAKGAVAPEEAPKVMAGHLEESGFNTVRGMVDLIRISRTYESLHRMIENYRSLDQRTAREVGGAQ